MPMTTPFAALGEQTLTKSASQNTSPSRAEINATPFALLDPQALEKSAGRIQDTVDGAVGGFFNPWKKALGNTFGGIRDAIGGFGKQLGGMARTGWNAFTQPINTAWGGITGGLGRAHEGLGGFVEGAWEGGRDAYKQDRADMQAGMNTFNQGTQDITGGARRHFQGVGQLASAPTQSMMGLGQGAAAGMYGGMASNAGSPATPAATPPAGPTAAPTPAAGAAPSGPGSLFSQMTQRPTYQGKPPAPVGSPPAGPTASAPPAPDWNQQFQKYHGTAFNPNSSLDQGKMQHMQSVYDQYGSLSPQHVYKSAAFALLGNGEIEKKAFAQTLGKGLKSLGGLFSRSSSAAKGNAGRAAFDNLTEGGGRAALRAMPKADQSAIKNLSNEAAGAVGNTRANIAGRLGGAGDALQAGGTATKAVNAGGLATLLGGTGLLAHGAGRNSGLSQGYDIGSDAAIRTGAALQPRDPGILGRIADVFTGQESGPNVEALQNILGQSKDDILGQILRGTA